MFAPGEAVWKMHSNASAVTVNVKGTFKCAAMHLVNLMQFICALLQLLNDFSWLLDSLAWLRAVCKDFWATRTIVVITNQRVVGCELETWGVPSKGPAMQSVESSVRARTDLQRLPARDFLLWLCDASWQVAQETGVHTEALTRVTTTATKAVHYSGCKKSGQKKGVNQKTATKKKCNVKWRKPKSTTVEKKRKIKRKWKSKEKENKNENGNTNSSCSSNRKSLLELSAYLTDTIFKLLRYSHGILYVCLTHTNRNLRQIV